MRPLTRRSLTTGLTALLTAGAAPASEIAGIERAHGGRLGVFVLNTGSGATLAYRADERFVLQSTFKGILAAMVLARVDAGDDRLRSRVQYGAHDIVVASPVTQAHLPDGEMTVGALCQAILERSDNTAANLLLARVGGPAALTAYARGLGDRVTRFDRYEPIGPKSGDMDTTTPRAIAVLARTVLLGPSLQPATRAQLEGWMALNVVGRTRLRAAFPKDWAACDRTGTADGICNDYALARPPGRGPLVMAAYYEAPDMALSAQEAVLREVGSAIVRWAA